ncbi:MAG: hypothetical protein A2430_02315 [Candidatus Liptonbacteria bacterium RIFOXYC1_FULL_36_8]|uniref:Uncharacterized protein n=2 Tax=Candidatus Liptoniibacteriota TaxID=1817909 RepID=A0A1G2CNV1_9BACT|nr:MAG: hypothetical protein A2430_02315 [Candidatus Liptonbacteria bacterium RIFOXYC1_FULL_36_8]OGZ03211.1 MAG: hypothetical protein A2604_01860 [Candidatus Liptonbacteria bacterium RIFOXYD1_FULL_36_11]
MKKENKVLIGVLGGIVIILGIIGLIKAGNFIFLIPVFIYFSESLHNGFGMDVWLARAIVVMLVVPFYFSVRMSTSLKKSERAQGIVFLSVMLCLCFFALFMHTGEQFFNHQTGEPIKWYAKTPEGYRFFDSPGYDPKYGIQLKPVGQEVVKEAENRQKQTQVSQQNQVEEGITFAPGETKKVIQLEPGKWTRWIITPLETSYRVDGPKDLLLRFIDGTVVENKSPSYVGVKRGIFKLTANSFGEVIVVVENRP